MIRLVLLVFAAVIFALLAFTVIDTDVLRWEWGALAAFALSFVPFDDWTKR